MAGSNEDEAVVAVEAVSARGHLHRYCVQRSSALDVEQGSVGLLLR